MYIQLAMLSDCVQEIFLIKAGNTTVVQAFSRVSGTTLQEEVFLVKEVELLNIVPMLSVLDIDSSLSFGHTYQNLSSFEEVQCRLVQLSLIIYDIIERVIYPFSTISQLHLQQLPLSMLMQIEQLKHRQQVQQTTIVYRVKAYFQGVCQQLLNLQMILILWIILHSLDVLLRLLFGMGLYLHIVKIAGKGLTMLLRVT